MAAADGVLIPFARTKGAADGQITDEKTLQAVKALMAAFVQTMSLEETSKK